MKEDHHDHSINRKRLSLCGFAGTFTVCIWIFLLQTLSHSEQGYLMNYFSVAFVGFALINLITIILNLLGKLFEIYLKVSKNSCNDFVFHFCTFLGGGPANTVSMLLLCRKVYDSKYHHYFLLTSFLHILLLLCAYRLMYLYG